MFRAGDRFAAKLKILQAASVTEKSSGSITDLPQKHLEQIQFSFSFFCYFL
jgi:hypothetical protein